MQAFYQKEVFHFFFVLYIIAFVYLLICSCLTVLGLCYCVGFFLLVQSKGSSLAVIFGLLIAVASLVAEHGL